MITYLIMVMYCLLMYSSDALYDKPLVTIVAKGLVGTDPQLERIIGNEQFVEWRIITEKVRYRDIRNSSLIILVKVNPIANFTEDEIEALVKWFNQGLKVLWVSSEGDYGEGFLRQIEINRVLKAIDSKLRVEYASVQDPFLNAGTAYRVLGVPCGPLWAKALTQNVKKVLFHTPSPIIALVNDTYVKLEEENIPNIYKIMCSSNGSFIANFNPPKPQVHTIGELGSTVLMALEVFNDKKSIVIVTGAAPFNHFIGMYMPKVKDPSVYGKVEEEGATLVRNIIILGINPHLLFEVTNLVSQLLLKEEELIVLKRKIAMLQEELKALNIELKAREEEIANLSSELKTARDVLEELREQIRKTVKEASLLKVLLFLLIIFSFILGLSLHRLSKSSIKRGP